MTHCISILLRALMMLPTISGGVPQGTPPELPLRAIYFLHIGESDKPIRPFVIALEEPHPSDLANIFHAPFWRHADIIVVPDQTLETVARIVRDGLAQAPPNASIPHPFGSFQLTFVMARSRNRVIMAPDSSKQIFRDLMRHIDPSQTTLRDYVSNLLRRLGVASGG